MESVQVSAKNLEEALRTAAFQLGLRVEQLEYEVLSEPRKLLGVIGTGQYTIAARPAETPPEGQRSPDAEAPPTAPPAEAEAESVEETPAAVVEPVPVEAVEPLPTAEEAEPRPAAPEAGEPEGPAATLADLGPPPTTVEEAAARAQRITSRILELMGLPGEVRLTSTEGEEALLTIEGSRPQGLLIGHHGDTLDSLQFLVAIAANQGVGGEGFRITLDSGGYRHRQEQNLRRMALRHADEAVASGREAVITGLKSYERRLVHVALRDREDVETYSEGEGLRRQLVISPKPPRTHA